MLSDIEEKPGQRREERNWDDDGDQPTGVASEPQTNCVCKSATSAQMLLQIARRRRASIKHRRQEIMKELENLDHEEAELEAEEQAILSLLTAAHVSMINSTKLLKEGIDDALIISAMNNGMVALFGNGHHTLVDGHTVWKDYHVAVCLLFFLIINDYACDCLEYGMRSQFYRHCVSGGKCETMMSYKQFSDTVSKLTANDIKKKVKMEYDDVEGETSNRTTMRQWCCLYWKLSDVFEKCFWTS